MSQEHPPGDSNQDSATITGPADEFPRAQEMTVSPAGSTTPEATAATGPACARCGQPLGVEREFCEACGGRVGASAALPPERPDDRARRWFPAVLVAWVVVMVAALVFLYSHALVVGST